MLVGFHMLRELISVFSRFLRDPAVDQLQVSCHLQLLPADLGLGWHGSWTLLLLHNPRLQFRYIARQIVVGLVSFKLLSLSVSNSLLVFLPSDVPFAVFAGTQWFTAPHA